MKKLMRKHKDEGFTLAELLIVVAIIAVLVAVSVPIFNTQLEKAREATDVANLRAAYGALKIATFDDSLANYTDGMYVIISKKFGRGPFETFGSSSDYADLPSDLEYHSVYPSIGGDMTMYVIAKYSYTGADGKWYFSVSSDFSTGMTQVTY